MASPNTFPGGLSLSGTNFYLGTLASYLPDYFSGTVRWLDTNSGNDASAGTLPQLPTKTLAQTVTNSAAGDVIVIAAGSSESILASQTFGLAGLTVLGCGTGITRPRYTAAYPAIDMFDVTAAATRFYNLYFPASTAQPDARIRFGAAEGAVSGCYFECGANDIATAAGVLVHTSANSCRIEGGTYFKSVASRPASAILCDAAVTDLRMSSVIVDGGTYGWSDYAIKVSAAATRIRVDNVQMLKESNFGITVTGTSYQCFGLSLDGTSRALFTA